MQQSKDLGVLSQQQRILLEQRLRERKNRQQARSIIPRRQQDTIPLASFAQQRLWFLHQLYPQSSLYNIPLALRLSGNLCYALLEQTFSTIIRRHESLRTTLRIIDGQLVQIVANEYRSDSIFIDLRTLPDVFQETEAQRLANEEAQCPFDLGVGPLIRMRLIITACGCMLLLTLHHVISDGWSTNILISEFTTLYSSSLQGQTAVLSALPIQYADYAIWQRQWLHAEKMQELLSYWTRQLMQVPVLQLPTDYPRSAMQRYKGDIYTFSFHETLSEEIFSLCNQLQVTPFIFLLAAFTILLYRYSYQRDIAVGVPISNRPYPELEGLIGFFTNTIVLRVPLSDELTFREYVARVREVALSGYSRQDLPFERLIEALHPDRDLSYTPVYQVMFNFQKIALHRLQLPGIDVSSVKIHRGAAICDLVVDIIEDEQRFLGQIEYDCNLFRAISIAHIAECFQELLCSLMKDCDQTVSTVSLLSPAVRRRIISEWNQTTYAFPQDESYVALFEASVGRTPDAIAVVYRDAQITFEALNAHANKLAHYLCALGVGPEILVGVYLNRSLEMVMALLAILKAGGAYVVLDVSYPSERLQFMIEDTELKLLITARSPEVRPCLQACQTLDLARLWSVLQEEEARDLRLAISAQSLAYMIYTSGSTGRPKGVAIQHRSMVNHSLAISERYALHSTDRVYQFYSLSFDASVEEIFPTLQRGATIVLRESERLLSGRELLELIWREQLSILNLPVVYWHLLVYELEQAQLRLPDCLRLVMVGSEKPSPARLYSWLQLGQSSWMNTYGPTEGTVTQTLFEATTEQVDWIKAGEVPIGKPIGNLRMYVLDHYLQPVPIGVIGEIYIGGEGVARGYFKRAQETAEVFIPDPFSVVDGARLYKTRDLGRYLADGNLEVSGRIDQQIKLYGFRIEPGEIEVVLGRSPGVRQAVVIVREDEPGQKQLVAYIVPDVEHPPVLAELEQQLKEQLPSYMVPSRLLPLNELPLGPTGKVDHRALPSPPLLRREATPDYCDPHTDREQRIARIWCNALQIERVGLHDNFFDLGGRSLSLVMVHRQVQQEFGHEFPLLELYRYPTVSKLASYLDGTLAFNQARAQRQKQNERLREAALRQKQLARKRKSL